MSLRPLNRILHVEDEPDIREIIRLVLRLIGHFTVQSCADGAEALLAAPRFQPDMILMDVMMPGMSGPETLARLRALAVQTQERIATMTATVTSPQGMVTVSVGSQGEVTALSFNSQDYRRTAPAELAHIVLDTIQRARQNLITQLADEMPAAAFGGITFRDVMAGTVDLEKMLPDRLFFDGRAPGSTT